MSPINASGRWTFEIDVWDRKRSCWRGAQVVPELETAPCVSEAAAGRSLAGFVGPVVTLREVCHQQGRVARGSGSWS